MRSVGVGKGRGGEEKKWGKKEKSKKDKKNYQRKKMKVLFVWP